MKIGQFLRAADVLFVSGEAARAGCGVSGVSVSSLWQIPAAQMWQMLHRQQFSHRATSGRDVRDAQHRQGWDSGFSGGGETFSAAVGRGKSSFLAKLGLELPGETTGQPS